MDSSRLIRRAECEWELPRTGAMRVPGVIYADEALIRAMDEKVPEQVANVAALPGIVKASFAMPDAHWGYGFRSAASPRSIPTKASCRRAAWASTFPAACARCSRASTRRR
jgi:tRNA-splicing ligase RtcB